MIVVRTPGTVSIQVVCYPAHSLYLTHLRSDLKNLKILSNFGFFCFLLDLFNYTECEELYNQCKNEIQDDDFKDVIKRTFFYSFHIWPTGEVLGCIYYFYKGKKLYVNAFASRHHHLLNLECFKKSLEWFKCNIYAEGLHRTSRLCLLKCGFKRVKGNLFIYRRNK